MMANYGAVDGDGATQNGVRTSSDEERATLLGKSDGQSMSGRLKRHMTADISEAWADLILLWCYMITGLLDSSSIFIWGTFASMQTGSAPIPHLRLSC